jgi:predicted O-linked N-acetylglucosamine transferase (SPINDLY family)
MTTDLVAPLVWHPQVHEWLIQDNYKEAISFYEQEIEADPENQVNYWHLGLLLLLDGQEAEAQTAWLIGMATGDSEQIEAWTLGLIRVLQQEIERREAKEDYLTAWILRQHLREIYPDHIDNLLRLVILSGLLERLTPEVFAEIRLIELLQTAQSIEIDFHRLMEALQSTLELLAPDVIILEFTKACCTHIRVKDPSVFRTVLLDAAFRIAHTLRCYELAAELLKQYISLDPNDVEVLGNLAIFCQDAGDYDAGIEIAQLRYELVTNPAEQIFSSHLILRGLMSAGGYWQASLNALQQHRCLLDSLKLDHLYSLAPGHTVRLFNATYYLPYFQDDLASNRRLQNQIVRLCHDNVQKYSQQRIDHYQVNFVQRRSVDRKLKVGYLSHCMCRHSVGWLARWLFQNHDRDRVELYGYFINYRSHDWLQEWYVSQMDQTCKIGIDSSDNSYDIADKIHQDEINILIDLDSITLDISCEVLALKPAPVQATWLGWDASGLPSVDYFIADPYVLPEDAQTYYSEKIWRLPQTYIAINGFEVDVPTLRRDQLGIPSDATIYLSTQKGYKRHRETAKLQMQIIRQVPGSYFLIKGFANQDSVQRFFFEIAEEEGVDPQRLKFLRDAPSESVHRGSLAIADVVLDTYPYNGATTTLETLWMGIPLVTRVGEQFAARNSYTMMVNAGISEGIAWSDEEYVEWGVRLGKDAALRQKIHWDLMRSRQTAPLWNGKQFAREMENAYQQMWEIYQNSL